jgi:hypothetical protein
VTITLERELATLTDGQLSARYGDLSDGELAALFPEEIDLDTLTAECDRRQRAEQAARDRADSARAASRARSEGWELAARANYDAAEAYCRGDANMLSPAGRKRDRAPFPWLWQGSRETADKYASDDLIRFWDYVQPRPAPPGQYTRQQRDAVRSAEAEWHHAHEQAAAPERPVTAWEAVPGGKVRETTVAGHAAWWAVDSDGKATLHPTRERAEQAIAPAETAPEPGSMVRFNALLARIERQALQTARALERVNGGIPR